MLSLLHLYRNISPLYSELQLLQRQTAMLGLRSRAAVPGSVEARVRVLDGTFPPYCVFSIVLRQAFWHVWEHARVEVDKLLSETFPVDGCLAAGSNV